MNLEQYDPEYAESVGVVITHNRASTSFLSRKLGCGYNTASRYMMRMQDEGIVSKPNHVGARQVLRSPALAADNIALQAEVERLREATERLARWAEHERQVCNQQRDRAGAVAYRRLCLKIRIALNSTTDTAAVLPG